MPDWIPVPLAQYQKLLAETAKAFDDLCRRHGIRYYAAYGTALGAVRHGGFIPWDDDMDVYLLRGDYDRLLTLGDDPALQGRYGFARPGDRDYPLPYAKFCNIRTSVVEDPRWPAVLGVFIDLFPLDRAPEDPVRIHRLQNRASRRFAAYRRGFQHHPDGFSFHCLLDLLYFRPLKGAFYRSWLRISRRLSALEGPNLTTYTRRDAEDREVLPAAWFEKAVDLPFEDGRVMAMEPVEEYLRFIYGDWQQLPPPEKRFSTHKISYLDLTARTYPPAKP
ncbi:MAG: LicD family protein [Bacteroidota bacterium]|nr:LicD family protein [Bacteroidota bacterium]